MAEVNSGEIPRALRVDNADDGLGQSQFVETIEILPSQFSGGANDRQTATFLLPKTGICDRDGFISFQSLTPPEAEGDENRWRFPMWAGAMSAIETASLWCGGVLLCQSRAVGHKYCINNFYRDPHNRDNKEGPRVQAQSATCLDRDAGIVAGPTTNLPCKTAMDSQKDMCQAGVAGPAIAPGVQGHQALFSNQGYYPNQYRRMTGGGRSGKTRNPSPHCRVYLDVLFPFLRNNNLPLGLLEDQCKVVIEFKEDLCRGQRLCRNATTNPWTAGVAIADAKLHLDIIYYDDPIGAQTTMEKISASLNAGTTLPFTDDAYVVRQVPAQTPVATTNVDVLLGLDHQVLRHIHGALPLADDYAAPATSGNALLGSYHSCGSSCIQQNGNFQETIQVKLNAQPVYPNPLDTDGKIFDQLCQVYPTPFKCSNDITSLFQNTNIVGAGLVAPQTPSVSDLTMDGQAQTTTLTGKGHYYGIPLSKSYSNALGQGTPIGRQPMVWNQTLMNAVGNVDAKTLHLWATCERALSIQGGKVMVSGS